MGRIRRTRKRVLVVGAGIAGLSAAHALRQRGFEVLVLEASNRAGGRIRTIRAPFADAQYAEAGARYVRSYHYRTRALVAELGLELVPVHPAPGANVVHVDGHRITAVHGRTIGWPASLGLTDEERRLGPNGIWKKAAASVIPEDRPPQRKHLEPYDLMTVAEFLRQCRVSSGGIQTLRLGLMQAIGEGIESYSALSALRLARPHEPDGTSDTVAGGMDRLPRHLARRMRGLVVYQAPVVAIAVTTGAVRVTWRHRGRLRSSEADHVVFAAPLTELRKVEFDPDLPNDKQLAIDAIPYTSVTRLHLQFRTRIWEEERLSGVAFTDLPIGRCLNASFGQDGKAGMLDIFTTGANARTLARLTNGDRIQSVLHYLARCFPPLAEELGRQLIGVAYTSWDARPWIGGGYAWFHPGQVLDEGVEVGRSLGRLHFAGDHTTGHSGWIEGALESAERVVGRIAG